MSLISVVQDVCAFVGVARPSSIFAGLNGSRTQQELLALANEMAQRIAYETREWNKLKKSATLIGDGVLDEVTGIMTGTEAFNMPADFQRMLKTAQVWRSTSAIQPMTFYPDMDQWLQRRALNYSSAWGEWTIYGGQMHIWPIMRGPIAAWQNSHAYNVGTLANDPATNIVWKALVAHTSAPSGTFAAARAANLSLWTSTSVSPVAVTARFTYLDKNCIFVGPPPTLLAAMPLAPTPPAVGDAFTADDNSYRLSERLLKLGMIWQWKADKGSPYAEDMGTYSDALASESGADTPAPIIIGRMPISTAVNVALPWPSTWGPQP
jgi:hypothetical protein